MTYALYHTLNKTVQTADLKKSEKEEIVRYVSLLSPEDKGAFFLLIYEHYRNEMLTKNENYVPEYIIPYEGVETTNGISFNLAKLPISLRRILFKFIKILQKG